MREHPDPAEREVQVAKVLRTLGDGPLSLSQAKTAAKLLGVYWSTVYRLRRRFRSDPVASSVRPRAPGPRGVPSVAFTLPPIAAVGLSENEARAQGRRFRTKSQKASSWFTARQAAEPVYGFKVLVEEDTELVLGAHLVGPHVDEVINLFALAIRHGLTAANLKATMFAYPTGASDIGNML